MWHWRQRPRQKRNGSLWWYHDKPLALCQACVEKALKDVRHVLGWCGNETYKEIRTRWYERLQESATELTPALWDAIRSGMMCVRGSLLMRPGAAVAAWHAASRRPWVRPSAHGRWRCMARCPLCRPGCRRPSPSLSSPPSGAIGKALMAMRPRSPIGDLMSKIADEISQGELSDWGLIGEEFLETISASNR